MANPQRGEVEIELGNETYTLRFGHNAVAEIENELGKAVGQIFTNEAEFGIHYLLVCLAAGLRHQDRKMTAKRVGNLLDKSEHGLEYYGERMGKAIHLVLNKGNKADEEDEDGAPTEDEEGNVRPLTGTDS